MKLKKRDSGKQDVSVKSQKLPGKKKKRVSAVSKVAKPKSGY